MPLQEEAQMSATHTENSAPVLFVGGRGLVESPRWHDGRLWIADWTAGEILALAPDGAAEVKARVPAPPLSFDFLPDGDLIAVSAREGRLLRQAPGGGLDAYAKLAPLAEGLWNEIVIDGRGNAYVNGGCLALVTPDGRVQRVADGFAFPNGMAITPDNRTLILAESHGRRLTGFDIAADGALTNRRIWADLGDGVPDGICIDAEGCVWYADVPNRRCVRVRQGGDVMATVALDRGGFACMLGGPDRRTLYIAAAQWFGMDRMGETAGTGQILSLEVDSPGAGWPYA
ncbi:SMP-30/gluconolactonase/LRE family protein [Phenylobacterium sp.]|uniref:SMP-30/gluconolactonase/LRE family protein n=1 Tax=Phenylobacterium sp. TaxID=1871053 RepID=UPI00374D448F